MASDLISIRNKGDKQYVYGSARQGAKKFQEDSYCYYENQKKNMIIMAVFDGHGGYNGFIASNQARTSLLQFCENNDNELDQWNNEIWVNKLKELFLNTHNDIRKTFQTTPEPDGTIDNSKYVDKGIVRNGSGDPIHGGATASICVIKREDDQSTTIISANVGDSTGLLFKLPIEQKDEIGFLTVDHGPENPEEFKRIQSLDSKQYPTKLLFVYDKSSIARKYECPLVFRPDGQMDQMFVSNPWGNGLHPTNVRYEPAVYAVTPRSVSKDTTCIAMTRALGDFYAEQFGLSHEPSIKINKLPPNTKFAAVVASDGIWDCWRYKDFCMFVAAKLMGGVSLENTVEHSLSESIQRAITNFGAKHYDDASMVLFSTP